ncbi:MAG: hypothetical protein EAZ07_02305 [Cytophagales bacterium]|nr:MAG: hypothetical protein EAZ07_02305 [Cytophagales bacterium]
MNNLSKLLCLNLLILFSITSFSQNNKDSKPKTTSNQTGNEGYTYFEPGKVWLDTDGNPIAAHGAGFMYHDGIYYWYGETRASFHSFPGFSCYSSKDLMNWKNEGYVLKPNKTDPKHDLYETNIIERPKVIFNAKTKKFVMWMHVEDNKYQKANAGVAVSDSPTGPFEYIKSIRPNGHESRDMGLFQDEDGKAYLIHASEKNSTQHINLLNDDYLDVEGTYVRFWTYQWREVPTIFKSKGKYYSITSLCTGFSPNAALYAVSDHILGEWKIIDNPCIGIGAESSFRSQASYIIPVANKPNTFIYMADRWTPTTLSDSRYIFLPIDFTNDNKIQVKWYEKWNWDKRVEGQYTENPIGTPLNIKNISVNNPSTEQLPDMVVKRRIPDQDFSALAWLGWKKGSLLINVMVYAESGSSLDGGDTQLDDDLFDIWMDYFQVSVSNNGMAWRVVPGGSGAGDYSGMALTKKHFSNAIKCSLVKGVSNKHASLLQLPTNTKGNLYTLEIDQNLAPMLSIEAGRRIALALVVNNKDRTGRGVKNRGYSPMGWRWADTDTYHNAVLIK